MVCEPSCASALNDDLPDPDLKIILLGDSAVGKSKLVERFLMDEYNPRQLSTYALTLFRKVVTLEESGEVKTVDFWDTAGQERYRTFTAAYFKDAHGMIIVYDVTSRSSFENVREWMKIAFDQVLPKWNYHIHPL